MKKRLVLVALTLVLALSVVIGLAGCGSGGSGGGGNSALSGEWKLTSAEALGQTLSGEQLEMFEYTFSFKDDGTATVINMGQTYDAAKYTYENETVTFKDDNLGSLELKLIDGKLVFEDPQGTKLFFEKQ